MASFLHDHLNEFFIGGDWKKASSACRIDVVNPATEELFFQVAEAQADDIDRAVAAAREAFDHGPWPRMTPHERAQYLFLIASKVEERKSEMAHVWSGEMGVTRAGADLFLGMAPGQIADYGHLAATFAFEEVHRGTGAGGLTLLTREPVGVIGAIIPWNAPMTQIAFKVSPALLAGCCVILKASPEAPGEAYIMASIAREVGLPPGVFNVITADRVASEQLVRNPAVDKISFTGSTAVGKRIGAICGERIARCTLELGGKSAAVILDDYDLDQAAKAISEAAPLLTGQVCASLTRLIVSRSRHDQFVDALSARFEEIKVGNPEDPTVQMGPLAMSRQRDRVEDYIARGVSEGAKLVSGGRRPNGLNRGYYIEPTVFANVEPGCVIAREEIFGPVVSVMAATSENEAFDMANDSLFGLNASVFTNDADRAYAAARKLRSGTVGQNGFRADFKVAFGGFKQSGIGRECGREGLMPYLEAKTIVLDQVPSHVNA